MRAVIGSVGALLISAAILLAGGGLLSTLIAIRASEAGFPLPAIGFMTSAYYAGFIAGCIYAPHLVKRVGHVRVFAALSALTAAGTLTHALFINIPVWVLLRGVIGFSFAGLYVLIESWINDAAPNEQRGQVLSIYRMVDLAAVTVGQFMLSIPDPQGFALYSVVAICISLAIFPISISTSPTPQPPSQTSLNLKKLIRVSPLASVGCFAVGMTNGAFWGVGPVFVTDLGHPVLVVSTFMSVVIFAGAVMQWPVGWLSDKFGRRVLILFISLAGVGAGVFLWAVGGQSKMLMLAGGMLYGLFAMQVFGLCAAHANDRAEPNEFVAVSGGLFLIYGVGSVIGPSAGAVAMSQLGPTFLFAYTAVIHLLLTVYTLYRIVRSDAPDDSADYIAVARPRSIAIIRRMDPRILRKKKRT